MGPPPPPRGHAAARGVCQRAVGGHGGRTAARSLRSQRPGGSGDALVGWFVQLSLLAVWRSLNTLAAPVARVLAMYVWAGKSLLKLTSFATRLVLRVTGWLASPAFAQSKWLRSWGRHIPWPIDVRKWHVAVAVVVSASLVNSLARKWRERFDERLRQLRVLQERMAAASSYAEWLQFAQQLDAMGRAHGASSSDVSGRIGEQLYDRKLLHQKLEHLQAVREQGSVKEMMFALRTDLLRNIANIAKSQLHEHFCEVPAPIREYIQEVKAQLAMLTDWPDGGLDMEEKLSFFRETRHAFGRTALLLSGGGGLGSFHLGVIKALFEHRMLPRVLAGSSVGSIVAGLVATRTDDELREMFRKLDSFELSFFNNSRTVELVHSFLQKGALHDMSFLQRKLKALIGNYTFLQAYERTGRILNVSVCPADTNEPARLLNYLTAPQALIWSAVAASSAFPGLFHPQDLLARNALGEEVRFSEPSLSGNINRRWRDGSLELDLPTFLLSEMFNCNHFIVSQTNPHIVPLLNLKKSLSRRWANLLELELRHRCAQLKWIMPDWFPTKWVSLFTQPWEGDITLVLPSHLWNVGKSIVNPTTSDILNATRQGELAIWEKLSAIETNCTIEATLDACLARLTNKARERPLSGLSSRIPSWLSMSTIGQQAVASWGNPLEAGLSSTGTRPWGSFKAGGLLGAAAAGSYSALPAVVQAQQAAAAAAAAAAVVRSGSSGLGHASSGGGLYVGSYGTGAAGVLHSPSRQHQQHQQHQQQQPHQHQHQHQQQQQQLLQEAAAAGDEQQAAQQQQADADSASGSMSRVRTHSSMSSSGPSTTFDEGPATEREALEAMANSANMGGLHSGYSYTAAAMHHAHAQQHGGSPRQHSPQQQAQPSRALGGSSCSTSASNRSSGQYSPAALAPGGLSSAFSAAAHAEGAAAGSGGGASNSSSSSSSNGALAAACHPGSPRVGSVLRSASSGIPIPLPPTIHENMADEKPARLASWGPTDIADSVSEFPAASLPHSVAAAADAAAAAVAAAYHARHASGGSGGSGAATAAASAHGHHAQQHQHQHQRGSGLLVRPFNSKGCMLFEEEVAYHLPTIPSSSNTTTHSAAAHADAAASARRRAAGSDSRRSSLSSNSSGAHAPSDVLGELDCCDASVPTDIWASLLPLATSSLVLEAAAADQGLDVIAP